MQANPFRFSGAPVPHAARRPHLKPSSGPHGAASRAAALAALGRRCVRVACVLGAALGAAAAGAAVTGTARPPHEMERSGAPLTAAAAAKGRAEVDSACQEFARRLPNVTLEACRQAQLQPSGAVSAKGRPLLQRDVSQAQDEARPPTASLERRRPVPPSRRVLVVGGIHGDELSSAALVIHWIHHAQRDGGDMQWRLVPLMNPDGAMARRPTRTNANGVDLNRNFPTPQWARLAPMYWKDRTRRDPRRYPGVKPLSEPETRWLHDEMELFRPNLIVSVHAPYGVLDFDGPSVPPQRLGRLYLDRVGIFPGSLGNYGGVHKNIPVVTIELSSAIRTPTEAEMRQMWLDLLRWIEERLPRDMTPLAGPESASIDCMSVPRSVVEVTSVACRDRPLEAGAQKLPGGRAHQGEPGRPGTGAGPEPAGGGARSRGTGVSIRGAGLGSMR